MSREVKAKEPQEVLEKVDSAPWWKWVPTTDALLKAAEQKMLAGVRSPIEQFEVKVGDHTINTIKVGSGPPIVLIHGFAAGIGFWAGNLDSLAEKYTVYAFDLLGFGRSSRPRDVDVSEAEKAEAMWIDSIEGWCNEMKLNRFVLLGHSLGGFLAGCYALKYPDRVQHLILADPWGVPKKPEERKDAKQLPLKWRLAAKVVSMGSPLSLLRAAGPYGPGLVTKFRPDIPEKFSHIYDDPQTVSSYIYHLNAKTPATGEMAFSSLVMPISWAKNPLETRLHELSPKIPATFLYGSQTWMDKSAGKRLVHSLQSPTNYVSVQGAGHHVYIDNFRTFNSTVREIAVTIKEHKNEELEVGQPKSAEELRLLEEKTEVGEAFERATGM